MTIEEFTAKLQMVYVGDRNAFNELVSVYIELQQKIVELNNINDKLSSALESTEQRIDKSIEYIFKKTNGYDKDPIEGTWLYNLYKVREILHGDS